MKKPKSIFRLISINEILGESKPNYCALCGRKRLPEQLNYEAMIHHQERVLRCIDSKSCERVKRKKAR